MRHFMDHRTDTDDPQDPQYETDPTFLGKVSGRSEEGISGRPHTDIGNARMEIQVLVALGRQVKTTTCPPARVQAKKITMVTITLIVSSVLMGCTTQPYPVIEIDDCINDPCDLLNFVTTMSSFCTCGGIIKRRRRFSGHFLTWVVLPAASRQPPKMHTNSLEKHLY
ncbi:MAG: hypothetical protein VB877_07345 [Pirellulaceae bacterium]